MNADVQKLANDRRVLIVGHADADGHLAVEQSRRNALDMGARECRTFVDARKTAGYRIWRNYLSDIPVGGADLVLFVDLMLRPTDPADSVDAIAELALNYADKIFIVIDHHPMLGLPALPDNVGIWFTSAVYTCCFGAPSWMMIVASICDQDEGPVAAMINPTLRHRAFGMQRAAADRDIAGGPLLRLLQEDRWDLIDALAQETDDVHRRVRGHRTRNQSESRTLTLVRELVS